MKDFIKTLFATAFGFCLYSIIAIVVVFVAFMTLIGWGDEKPIVPESTILSVNMSKFILMEQTTEPDFLTLLQDDGTGASFIGIHDAIKAINTAASDPSVSMIYLQADMAMGGISQIEEFRSALENFRQSGKPIVAYVENPTNAGMYLASASDRVYMTPYCGNMNLFTGISSQMVFLKDLLDKLGINVQLIRHGKYKSAGEMFINSAPSDENMEQNQSMVESIWKNWSTAIAESRNMRAERLNTLLEDLELKSSEDFMYYGLVDELITSQELHSKLAYLSGLGNGNINFTAFADYELARRPEEIVVDQNKIAVVFLEGEIIDGFSYDQISADRFVKILSDIRHDPSVKATVIRINSPGGSVHAAEKILAEIELLQQQMPVIASYGDYAASGGYWISAGCDKIYSNASTLTGSIGVFSMVPDFSQTLNDKLHVNIVSVNSNKHADMYNMMRPLEDEEILFMQSTVEDTYERFISLVAKGRNLDKDYVEEIAQGRIWSGSDALEIGLVDEIGTIDDAVYFAVNSISSEVDPETLIIESYPLPLSDWEMFFSELDGTENILADTPFKNIGEAFQSWTSAQAGKAYARIPYEYIIR